MQVAAFWCHNFLRSLAKNKLHGVLNLFSMKFNQKVHFNMSNNVIKECGVLENLEFWVSWDQWFDSYIIIIIIGPSSVDR